MQKIEMRLETKRREVRGVLVLPDKGGPFPVVVFIHGSGFQNREGYHMYPEIWSTFANIGSASFSWDKPSFRQTLSERIEETLSVIQVLSQSDNIDSTRIGIWGISEAGWIFPIVASRLPEIAFVISVSTPCWATTEDRSSFRIRSRMQIEGFERRQISLAISFFEKQLALWRAGASFEKWRSLIEVYANEPWFGIAMPMVAGKDDYEQMAKDSHNCDSIDPIPYLETLRCPVLAIFGAKDTIVPVSESIEAYRNAATVARNQNLTIEVFAHADHEIKVTREGKREFAPGYLPSMAKWLSALLESIGGEKA